ncbi:BRAP2 RING ZnF UBP domain-containing protein 2-like isoform X1 [Populus alba x Populus x berolinensis]|uniref:BRAP2 RING ZnF UBP domain-containing protein 2-like isoform X1 n=1 Tax=Populus alba x Populus x berolinensis TaxID=444605 RepID=A0AAD6QVK2_9ROSI|nr:BRAP2 RING ZnF UBP domain-containing protein 2-like isoform X1 [Populus alba x Populus x berolinensis]
MGGMSPSSSAAAVSGATLEDHFWQPTAEESSSQTNEAFPFSSGNPRIEETRGVMHLFSNNGISDLPVERKPLVAVVGVPNHMTYADFCQFCASFIHHILEMRIVRLDGMEDRYSILIRFDTQDSTDKFYLHFNGRQFNSLEEEVCRVLFTVDVQFTGYSGSLEHTKPSSTSTTEQPSCPVCLERLDQDMGGILTTICNHSFHCSCISKWTDSSCPVCRYCQQQPEKSICFLCQTSENLWICVLCGFVGCGRYKGGHAIRHWKETQHCYSLELDTQRVWDYVGDNYVHRLIQSKTDGKLVELNSHCVHAYDGCGGCECADSGVSEALLKSKVEAIVNEYNELLATQLENQKLYFDTLLKEVNEETEREISEAVKKAIAQKLQKLQAKLDRCIKEKKFLDDLNENLVKNQEIWKAKISEIEEREKMALKIKDDKIQDLEEQLRDLMMSLEAGKIVEQQLSIPDEVKDGTVLPISVESSSGKGPKGRKKADNPRES